MNPACSEARPCYRNDTLVQGTPYMQFSIFLLAWTVAFFISTLGLLLMLRRWSLYKISTSWIRIVCFDLACLGTLLVGPIRDLIGYEHFICELELWARVLTVFGCVAACSLEITFLQHKIALAQLLQKANFQTLQEFTQRENNKAFVRSESRRKIKSIQFPSPLKSSPLVASSASIASDMESNDHPDGNSTSAMKDRLTRALWFNSTTYRLLFVGCVNLAPLVLSCVIIQLTMPFYGMAGWKLRQEPDRSGSLRKLARDYAIILPMGTVAIATYCFNTSMGLPIDLGLYSPDWVFIILFNLLHYLEVPREIGLAMFYPKTGLHYRQEFETLLQDAHGLGLFTRYLETEYNSENIRFYTHAKAFRDGFDHFRNPIQAKLAAEEIYWTFCHQGAVLEINLPDSIRQDLTNKFTASGLPRVVWVRNGPPNPYYPSTNR
ncbi:hypothetical protein BASA81_000724 [Batrachochytrium salamandrivorans]|nr:hypothetical protein BASA81_000724 [Batrachochytrium salamandrivorans]